MILHVFKQEYPVYEIADTDDEDILAIYTPVKVTKAEYGEIVGAFEVFERWQEVLRKRYEATVEAERQ